VGGEQVLDDAEGRSGPGDEAGGAAGRGDQVVHAGVVGRAGLGQRQVGERGQVDRGTVGGGEPGWDGGVQGLVPERVNGDVGRGRGSADESRVQVPGGDRGELDRRGGRDELDVGGGPAPAERGEDLLQARPEDVAAADAQQPGLASRQVGGGASRLAAGVQDPAGVGQERLPVGGEGDLPAGAVEQLDPQLAFQPGDLLADRGLNDVQRFGGPAEMTVLGDGHEVPQLPQLHGHLPPLAATHHGW
jgi:hypothetical protein